MMAPVDSIQAKAECLGTCYRLGNNEYSSFQIVAYEEASVFSIHLPVFNHWITCKHVTNDDMSVLFIKK